MKTFFMNPVLLGAEPGPCTGGCGNLTCIYIQGPGQLVGQSAGVVIERLRVRIPAGPPEEFSSPELTLCAGSYSVSVPPPCYRSGTSKDPGHWTKSTGGRIHVNTHTPWTQRSRSELTTSLSGYSVRTYPETSSHATCQGTFGHSRLNSLSHCGLILA